MKTYPVPDLLKPLVEYIDGTKKYRDDWWDGYAEDVEEFGLVNSLVATIVDGFFHSGQRYDFFRLILDMPLEDSSNLLFFEKIGLLDKNKKVKEEFAEGMRNWAVFCRDHAKTL